MIAKDNLTKKYHYLFLCTAIYNWFVAFSMLKPAGAFEAMGITPVPAEDNMLHTCCLFIGMFGFIYYWASQDFPGNADLVWLGMAMKASNIVFATVDVYLGVISWQFLILLSPDMVLVCVFYMALHEVKKIKQQ